MPFPDVDSLRCFVEAARLLNFRAASRVVGLSPAALGQRIRRLEEDLGAALFDRDTQKVRLTEAGLALVPAARRALDALADCERAARGEAGPVRTDVVIGTRHELGLSWLVPQLPRLRAAHPGTVFHLYFGSGADLELRVLARQVDCAVSSRAVRDPRLEWIQLHREDYRMVASPALLAAKPIGCPADATAHTLVDATSDLELYRYFRSAPGGEAWRFGDLLRMGATSAIRALVLDGQGVAVLPEYLVREDLRTGRLSPVSTDVEPLPDHFRLVFRADDPRRERFAALAASLAEEELR